MRFPLFLSRCKGLEHPSLPAKTLDAMTEKMEAGVPLSEVAAAGGGNVPLEALRRFFEGWDSFTAWGARVAALAEERTAAGLPALPEAAIEAATSFGALDALARAARLLPPDAFPEPGRWSEVLVAAVDLWDRCFSLARTEGRLRSEAATTDPAVLAPHEEYVGRTEVLGELPGHRVLAYRRGERAGALRLVFTLPVEEMEAQARLFVERAGLTGSEAWSPERLLAELVLDDIVPVLRAHLDDRAGREAVRLAARAYRELLSTPPISARRLGAVAVGGPLGSSGVVILDDKGRVVKYQVTRHGPGWVDEIVGVLRRAEVTRVVLPATAACQQHLQELLGALHGAAINVVRVRSAGLAEAREALEGEDADLPRAAASAAILGRRALDPFGEWTRIDPVCIGLAPYQADVDEGVLRAALEREVSLLRLEAEKSRASASSPRLDPARAVAAARRLNPLVTGIEDLRPGMTLQGIVTNVASFGVFVNIGLNEEGLVHVSQLSNAFVDDPTKVAVPGQQVSVRVLGVDRDRRRIALTMRSETRPGSSGSDGGDSQQGATPRAARPDGASPRSPRSPRPLRPVRSGPRPVPAVVVKGAGSPGLPGLPGARPVQVVGRGVPTGPGSTVARSPDLGPGDGPPTATGPTRSQVLRELEKLFKK